METVHRGIQNDLSGHANTRHRPIYFKNISPASTCLGNWTLSAEARVLLKLTGAEDLDFPSFSLIGGVLQKYNKTRL